MVASYVVGRFAAAPPAQFDWNAASASGTAFGTLFLAVVTGVLAVLTNEDVQLTRALESERHRPTLVLLSAVVTDVVTADYVLRGNLQAVFENVGVGPAINVVVSATHPNPLITVDSTARLPAIAPGTSSAGATNIPVSITGPEPQPGEDRKRPGNLGAEGFAFTVHCLDRTLAPVPNALVPTE